jgi:hypothetical protein
MGLGVVIAGLGIGALVAVFMQHNADKLPPVALATLAPATPAPARPTPPPIAIATIEPPRTPRPSPSPSLRPTIGPSAAAAPSRKLLPAGPAAARVAVVTPAPAPAATSTRPPEPSSTAPAASPTSAAPATPVVVTASASPETQSVYDEHATAVVRRYLDALIRGDEKTAYDALGGSGTLSEQTFLDPSAHIVSVKVTRIDASNASVGCEVAAAKGNYYVTFRVTAATSGPYIATHDYIKV